jgi:dCMP deaminase
MHKYWPIVIAVSKLSKDPKRQVGALIVNYSNDVLTSGYNGFPRGIEDSFERLHDTETKLKLTVHAEQNAISNAARLGIRTMSTTMLVNLCPCLMCAKAIIQAGITSVICTDTPKLEPNSKWAKGGLEAIALLREANINLKLVDWK